MLLPLTLCLLLPPALQVDRDTAWGEDLIFLVEQLETLHPSAHHGVPIEEFELAVSELYARIPELSDDRMIVEFMRLFGLHSKSGQEGHCMIHPGQVFERLPLGLYRFENGWFVVRAAQGFEDLLGAELTAISGQPVEDLAQELSALVTKDNESSVLSKLPDMLPMPRLLAALGIGDGLASELELVLPGGNPVKRRVLAEKHVRFPAGLPEDARTLWLSQPARAWWTAVLEKERALYVQFNQTQAQAPGGERLEDFAAGLIKTFEEQELERLVLDVRLNNGGDNTSFGPLIQALKAHAKINRPGALYALIGRGTFSAAGNLITVLEQETAVTLVGEPTGGGPNQYGDARPIRLPHHPQLIVRISTRYHEFDAQHPERLTHEPGLAVGLKSSDYFGGKDPVLERALGDRPRKLQIR